MMDLASTAAAIDGRLSDPAAAATVFDGVSTDSRTLAPGSLFVALAGERFDGHGFLAAAAARGAVAAMVDAARQPEIDAAGLPLVAVADTRRGLGQLAAAWRRRFGMPLVAVTGSNGKTTVKEMVAAILRAQAVENGFPGATSVLATRGNLNNDIGLPLTLLGLSAEHRFAVVELGMNHPGEIAALAAIAAPTVALVNNAQRAHVEGMGSLDAIAREKGALLAHSASNAIAVINADDPAASLWRAQAAQRRVVDFALADGGIPAQAGATVRGEAVAEGLGSRLRIELAPPFGPASLELRLAVPGIHNVRNALAAAAAALAAGAGLAAVAAGLAGFGGVRGRLQRRAGRGGARILDDTYNANPDSVRAGLEVLAALPGRRLFVFGDMGETGPESLRFHEEVGTHARRLGIDGLLALGASSARAAAGFGAGGAHFAVPEALVAALLPELDATTTVLVKGSRFMKMERVADALCDAGDGGETH